VLLELALGLIAQDEGGRRVLKESVLDLRAVHDGAAMDRHGHLVARQGPVARLPANDGMIQGDAPGAASVLPSRPRTSM
jgi:hypothetical protein